MSCGWLLGQEKISNIYLSTGFPGLLDLTDPMQALPIFHAYTGCDTVSLLRTRSKKSAWDTWKAFDGVTATFLALSTGAVEMNDDHVASLEQFTILLYDHISNVVNIDEACQELFIEKGRYMNAIPPIRAALVQHIKRAVYQGGHCWGKMLEIIICMASAEDWDGFDPQVWKGSQCALALLLDLGEHCCQGASPLRLPKRMCTKMQIQEGSSKVHCMLCVCMVQHVWNMTT